MEKKWSTRDFVVVAMVGVVFGVLFLAMDSLYLFLSPMIGPVVINIVFGLYCLSALVPISIVRKPGAGVLGSVVTALTNILVGSPYGINILVAGLLQGLGTECGFAVTKYKQYKILNYAISAIFITLFVTIRDYFVFGLNQLPLNVLLAVIGIRLVSAFVIGGGLALIIGKGLRKIGALNN